ncbi:hypothetical protein GCM10009836_61100 [Pseudonocardia ailaonensis]|uniref:SnoaL-like domain-containing protein n=1 Tax=Pseudonocardia ailaonensis TaxID=367279 RepID=A0ABN2NKG4_9PSEU
MASKNLENFLALMAKVKGMDPTSDASLDIMQDYVTPDMEFVQPPSFPHGGVHGGRDGWRHMAKTLNENWQLHISPDHMWDIPEEDVVVLYVNMEWTAQKTGRTVHYPTMELLRFKDGRIARAEIFPQDTHAVLETLNAHD